MADWPDYAIVVGIERYPELDPLGGPENDARAFHAWVTGQPGVQEAKLILSSEHPATPTATGAEPTAQLLRNEFDRLADIAAKNNRENKGKKVGRRLYLYLAGHGFGPDLDSACLLMANATPNRTSNHVPGKPWANHFVASGYFDEVLLFMDCCRERYSTRVMNIPDDLVSSGASGWRFYGFASKYMKLSKERTIGEKVRGVFTVTLLNALQGGAANSEGKVTARSLSSYLFNNMKEQLSDEDRLNSEIAQEPDIYVDPLARDEEFVITVTEPKRFPVKVTLPEGSPEKTVVVIDSGLDEVARVQTTGGTVVIPLLRAKYLVQLVEDGRTQKVDVRGTGGENVQF
jgi:hypothetical protein